MVYAWPWCRVMLSTKLTKCTGHAQRRVHYPTLPRVRADGWRDRVSVKSLHGQCATTPLTCGFNGGRYWDRTSNLVGVNCRHGSGPSPLAQAAPAVRSRAGLRLYAPVAVLRCCTGVDAYVLGRWSLGFADDMLPAKKTSVPRALGPATFARFRGSGIRRYRS